MATVRGASSLDGGGGGAGGEGSGEKAAKRSRTDGAAADAVPAAVGAALCESTVEILMSTVLDDLDDEALATAAETASDAVIALRTRAQEERELDFEVAEAAEKLADAAREATFPGLASDDSESYNGVYAYTSILWAEAAMWKALARKDASRKELEDAAAGSLRACDLAMLRGEPTTWGEPAESVVRAADALLAWSVADSESEAGAGAGEPAKAVWPTASAPGKAPTHRHMAASNLATNIPRVDGSTISAAQFRDKYLSTDQPVVLTGLQADWPAARLWGSPAYLQRRAGRRLVQVETYASKHDTTTYLSSSWERRVMPLSEYIDTFVQGAPSTTRGYLAQYPLFDQLPSLRDDIRAPELCSVLLPSDSSAPEDCETQNDEPFSSAWLGPEGTVTPLHNDPYHNLLAQIVGYKYVRLYLKDTSDSLYARPGDRCNNSHVDLDADAETASKYPLFGKAPYFHTVLAPGETLFMPRHAWHYVRSLSVSFSASFWWGAKMGLANVGGKYKSVY